MILWLNEHNSHAATLQNLVECLPRSAEEKEILGHGCDSQVSTYFWQYNVYLQATLHTFYFKSSHGHFPVKCLFNSTVRSFLLFFLSSVVLSQSTLVITIFYCTALCFLNIQYK